MAAYSYSLTLVHRVHLNRVCNHYAATVWHLERTGSPSLRRYLREDPGAELLLQRTLEGIARSGITETELRKASRDRSPILKSPRAHPLLLCGVASARA